MAIEGHITATVKAKYETDRDGAPLKRQTQFGMKPYFNIMLDIDGDTRYATVWSRKLYDEIVPQTMYVFDAKSSDPDSDKKWMTLRKIISVGNGNPTSAKRGNSNGYDSEVSIKSRMANTALMQAVALYDMVKPESNSAVAWIKATADSLYSMLYYMVYNTSVQKKSEPEPPDDDPLAGEEMPH